MHSKLILSHGYPLLANQHSTRQHPRLSSGRCCAASKTANVDISQDEDFTPSEPIPLDLIGDEDAPNNVLEDFSSVVQGVASGFMEDAEAERPEGPAGELQTVKLDGSGLTGEVIRVGDKFTAEEGLQLTDDLVIGKLIGGGAQGEVYDLRKGDGSDSGSLLKVMKYKAAVPITGLDIGLKREWLIGQQLNKLKDTDGKLQGFMGTGAALLGGSDGMLLEGLILEKLNGWTLEKRLMKDESFADAAYLIEMLTQIFTALDRAYKELGFRHRDMQVGNVMEDRPEAFPVALKGYFDKKDQPKFGLQGANQAGVFKLPGDKEPKQLKFKIIDYGHSRLKVEKAKQKLPKVNWLERWYRRWFEGKGDVWRLLQDLSPAIDGRTWPQEQEPQVRLLFDLIKEVLGVRLYADYDPRDAGMPEPWAWQKVDGTGHEIRRLIVRGEAWLYCKRTDYTAEEALQFLEEGKKKWQ